MLPGWLGREVTGEMMRARGLVDVLIPRGGAGLIRAVVDGSTVPVIETGTGNCHVYVDATADAATAEAIILNAKTQRPGVCNALETLLIHEAVGHGLDEIAEATEQQRSASAAMASSIDMIAAMTRDNTSAVESTASAARDLESLACHLQQTVERFRV